MSIAGPDDPLRIHCRCGAGLKIPRTAIGRKVKCPKCAEIFTAVEEEDLGIPISSEEYEEPDPTPPPPPPTPKVVPNPQVSAPANKPVPAAGLGTPCPLCSAPLGQGALLCTACGYDTRTGKRIKSTGSTVSAAARIARSAGTLLLGCIFSGIGALIGAAIWAGIAMAISAEIGWIAWGIGLLAGGGMVLGYRKHSTLAGLIAMGISFAGVMIGKLSIFIFVIYAVLTGSSSDIELQRAFVQQSLANQSLDDRGIFDETRRDREWEAAYDDAGKTVVRMTDDEVRSKATELKQEMQQAESASPDSEIKKTRLARHHAELMAETKGIAWNDPRREEFIAREKKTLRGLGDEEVKSKIAELERWHKEGRWADSNYVRNRLVFRYIEEDIRESPPAGVDVAVDPESWEISPGDWQQFHNRAVTEVEALSSADRLIELKEIEDEAESKSMRLRLAFHEADFEMMRQGFMRSDSDKRDELQKAAQAKLAGKSHGDLTAAAAQLDEWEKTGKASDAEYQKLVLTYALADQAIDAEATKRRAGTKNASAWTPSAEEWKKIHADAVTEASIVPEAHRAERTKKLEEERLQAMLARFEQSEETSSIGWGVLIGAFFQSMFHPLDLLFFFLALSTAYRIGARGWQGKAAT